ncbi:MAG TPA: L-glutamate gamma-semialdehyde dehydrogenase [Chitinophagales bacterium]|nr:L-glutamate gamma-semialdehyde dehydrogenase [Chitinophagales bacterium]
MLIEFRTPPNINEWVKNYGPGSAEREELKAALKKAKSKAIEIPMVIGGKNVKGKKKIPIHPPHELKHKLGAYYLGEKKHVAEAIDAALKAKHEWEHTRWDERAAVFLRAADLLRYGWRQKMNAATMLCQSKNVHQSEIDAVCELADFFRFNVHFMQQIYAEQPYSPEGVRNSMDYRPLEGFVLAITPFNFTSIAGNLPTAPALMGNTVVWKPASTQIYSAWTIMELLREAGLPKGVINLITSPGSVTGEAALNHPELAGVHFTGSTATFQHIWKTIGNNISKYKSYPRIVGETGGKDFVIAHPSADVASLVTALTRGAFEYQGQKCSAASRAYIPANLWKQVKEGLQRDIASFKIGSPEDFSNFINAVIDAGAFDKITSYIRRAKKDKQEIIAGGNFSSKEGYFIEPTVIVAKKPGYVTMCEEIFGPVLTVYVYPEKKFEEALELVDTTSPYGLTGAIFSQDRKAISIASQKLRYAAGNFYINDKPTGAVVGQQPFGGSRASGTNDKAGSYLNLIRWTSPRAIKENLNPPKDYRYPFMM